MYKLWAIISSVIVIPIVAIALKKIFDELEYAFLIGDIRLIIAVASLGIIVICLTAAFGTFINFLLDCAKQNKKSKTKKAD